MNSFSLLMLLIAGFFLAMTLMRLLTLDDFSTITQLVESFAILVITGGLGGYALLKTYALMPFCVGVAVLAFGAYLGDKWTVYVEEKHN